MHRHRHVILHSIAKFRSNQTIVGGVITSYPLFKMAAGSNIGFDLDNVRQHTQCNCRSQIAYSRPFLWSFSVSWRFAIFARAVSTVFRHKDGAIMKSEQF